MDFGIGAEGDVAEVGDGGDVVADGEVGVGLGAGAHAIEEIAHVGGAGVAAGGMLDAA